MSIQVENYDSFDSMMDAIGQQVERAKSWIRPRQAAITYGDYWMSPRPDLGIIIFGRITPRDEMDATERRLGASEEEIEEEHRVYDASYESGFRFGMAYSSWEARGELGDTHVSTMLPITEEEFLQAQDALWSPEVVAEMPWFEAAFRRIQ